MDYSAMGHRIRILRNAAGMTQQELANQCGRSVAFIGHIERGSRKASLETYIKIAGVLEISLDEMILGIPTVRLATKDDSAEMCVLDVLKRVLLEHSDEWFDTIRKID